MKRKPKPRLDPLPVVHLRLVPIEIAFGQTATLSWTSENCVEVTLNGTDVPLNSDPSIQVGPLVSTTYTLIGYAEDGTQTRESVRLTVDPPSSPKRKRRKK